MKFVIDAGVALHLAEAETTKIPSKHELLAPTLIRSEMLSAMHEAVHRNDVAEEIARDRLERASKLPMRLLGDAVLRRRAWELATRLGWAETYQAEYLALTQLQGDAFVTLDKKLARRAEGLVQTATVEALGAKR